MNLRIFPASVLALLVLAGCTPTTPQATPTGGVVVSTPAQPKATPSASPSIPIVADDDADIGDPLVDTGEAAQASIEKLVGTFAGTLARHPSGFQETLKKLALPSAAAKIDAIDPGRIPDLGAVVDTQVRKPVVTRRTDTVVTFDSGVALDVSVSYQGGQWLVWGWVPRD